MWKTARRFSFFQLLHHVIALEDKEPIVLVSFSCYAQPAQPAKAPQAVLVSLQLLPLIISDIRNGS